MKTELTTNVLEQDALRQRVRETYGRIAERVGEDGGCGCGTGCCSPADAAETSAEAMAERARVLGYSEEDLAAIPEGANLGLGCGNPGAIAALQPGQVVLDLGSGAGFDVFLAARAVGANGRVIGVDMTPAMVSKARANAVKGGYANVEFRLGEIEALPVADASVDVILSNCVINLSPDKVRVYREAHRVLKPGGTLAVSDVVALKPLPEALKQDFEAYTGCVAGAALIDDVERMLRKSGFSEVKVRVSEASRAFINDLKPDASPGDYVASANITARKA